MLPAVRSKKYLYVAWHSIHSAEFLHECGSRKIPRRRVDIVYNYPMPRHGCIHLLAFRSDVTTPACAATISPSPIILPVATATLNIAEAGGMNPVFISASAFQPTLTASDGTSTASTASFPNP